MPSLPYFSHFFGSSVFPATALFKFGTVSKVADNFFKPTENLEIFIQIIIIFHPKKFFNHYFADADTNKNKRGKSP